MTHFAPGDSIAAQAELQRHPFQGPDKFGNKTLKIWGRDAGSVGIPTGTTWRPHDTSPWKPKKAAKPSASVEMSQRIFYSREGFRFIFWALAPATRPSQSWHAAGRSNRTEYVWLILEGTNGRGVHHALVDKETDEVYWHNPVAEHFQKLAS